MSLDVDMGLFKGHPHDQALAIFVAALSGLSVFAATLSYKFHRSSGSWWASAKSISTATSACDHFGLHELAVFGATLSDLIHAVVVEQLSSLPRSPTSSTPRSSGS